MKIIVDGDNAVRALGFRQAPEVEQFLQRLERIAAERDWEVVVVFDGPERFLPRETGLLVVRYAVGRTADSVIERMVHEEADRSAVVVVTQDRAQADLVRGMGAIVWAPRRLGEEMSYNKD